jgi:hypothetical protein
VCVKLIFKGWLVSPRCIEPVIVRRIRLPLRCLFTVTVEYDRIRERRQPGSGGQLTKNPQLRALNRAFCDRVPIPAMRPLVHPDERFHGALCQAPLWRSTHLSSDADCSHEGERLTVVTHTAAATFTVNRQRPASAALVHTRGSTFGGQQLTRLACTVAGLHSRCPLRSRSMKRLFSHSSSLTIRLPIQLHAVHSPRGVEPKLALSSTT